MSTRATFGDFAVTATRQLRALQTQAPLLTGDNPAAAGSAIDAVAHAMTGYVEDVCAIFDAIDSTGKDEMGPWIRAAGEARRGLAAASASLQDEPDAACGPDRDWPTDARASGLRSAAVSMTLGRDLLHTHLRVRDDLVTANGASEWAPVVSSQPVARGLLHQVGQWARQVTAYIARSAWQSTSGPERQGLNTICQGLFTASCAIGVAQEQRPVRADELRLLAAVPVNAQPPAKLPAASDPASRLCDGVIDTAGRLRLAARRAAARATWSPELTRESLRQTAGCCAITASNLQILLSTLASRHGRPSAPFSAALADGASAADRARAAWLHVAEAWDSISTDTRGTLNATAAEAVRLAQWTGRLAYANPDWTPVLGPRHQPRPSAELAPDHDHLRQLVDAAHHACHTLAAVADSEQRQVRTASMTGRLIVPTRSLPESFDVPYRFAPAPGTRAEPLLSSYNLALQASDDATAALAGIAAEVKASSQLLTSARAAAGIAASPDSRLSPRPVAAASAQREPGSSLVPRMPKPTPPGPVERILLDLSVTSPADLERAAALDSAAEQLILHAAKAPRPSQPTRNPSRSAGTAELINHLLITTNGNVPAALTPGEPRRSRLGRRPIDHSTATPSLSRHAELQAGN